MSKPTNDDAIAQELLAAREAIEAKDAELKAARAVINAVKGRKLDHCPCGPCRPLETTSPSTANREGAIIHELHTSL
jgi:hypothetical protein